MHSRLAISAVALFLMVSARCTLAQDAVNLDSAAPEVSGTAKGGSSDSPAVDADKKEAPAVEKEDKAEKEDEEEEKVDPCMRPLQYFKDEFVESCCAPLWMKDVQVNGYLDQTYTYNFNRPDNPRYNTLRVFDRKHNSYLLNMFQLHVAKDPTPESRWGFHTKVSTGWDTDVIASFNEDNTDKFDWQELYGSYLFDIGENGLLVKAGRMVTLAGAEVIEQKDNWNISRSLLFGYAIPFTHTGVRASYKINDIYDFTFGVNRGWDTSRYDNNDSVSYEARLGATCSDKLSLSTVFITGPEQADNDTNDRRLLDFVATYKFNKKLTGMVNIDIAREEGATANGGDAKWHGVAGYLKYECDDKLSYAYRAEIFKDDGGTRTGTDQTLWENTVTAQYKFRENLWGRLEFRHDSSTDSVFAKGGSGGLSSGQNTIAASVLVTF